MFDFKAWLKQSYINLVKDGTWSRDYCAVMCEGQMTKCRFSDTDVEDIYVATEPVVEPVVEEIPVDPEPVIDETPIEPEV